MIAEAAESPGANPAPAGGGARSDPAWAWARYAPDSARPWNLQRAAHLCRRAGFGADWGGLQTVLAEGPQASVTRFLHGGAEAAKFNGLYDGYEQAAAGTPASFSAWWLRRMIETPQPLLERMTLFWHGYFGLSAARVGNPELVCQHLRQLRAQALGRFDLLLGAAMRHPAVLLGLNARNSRKARPETDSARVLLEAFALGAGHFSEADVQAVARALTGWHVSQWEIGFNPDEHDAGPKTLFGETGNWGREDVVRLLLKQPATARHVVEAVYCWFISESRPLEESVVAPLAETFARDYDVARLVETVLRSNLFFSVLGEKIKSPVDFAVGIVRAFGAGAPTLRLAQDLSALGQDLLEPPTLKGWVGGRDWINRFTLLGRARLAGELFSSSGAYAGKLDPEGVAAKHGCASPDETSAFLFDLLVQESVSAPQRTALLSGLPAAGSTAEPVRRLAAFIATLPEFHLA